MDSIRDKVPAEISNLCKVLKDAGFESYLVGGCVRDMLVSREPKDWDITTNATPEQIQGLFDETFYENEYGTVGVVTGAVDERLRVIEVTPYRIESGYSNARHPDAVEFSTSILDDLKRRDFTVNAIAYNPLTGELVDEHEGRADLDRKIIRAVGEPGERFSEDALRMMRAVRLSAELDFALDAQTMLGIAKNAALLTRVSRERVRDELSRIIMSDRPMQALFVAQKLGILKYIIPELEEAIGIDQNQAHSYDVFEHLLRSMQHAADKNWDFDVRLAALLHDIGKPASRRWSDEKKDWTFHGHEVIGAKMAAKILKDLRFSRETIDTVVSLIRWHMFFSDPDTVTLSAVRRIISHVGREHIAQLLDLRICDRIGTGRPKEQPFRLRKYMSMVDEAMRDPLTVGMLKVDGQKVIEVSQEKAGPRTGWILHALLEEVLDDPAKNTDEYLVSRVTELARLSDSELKNLGMAGRQRLLAEEAEAVKELREKHHVN